VCFSVVQRSNCLARGFEAGLTGLLQSKVTGIRGSRLEKPSRWFTAHGIDTTTLMMSVLLVRRPASAIITPSVSAKGDLADGGPRCRIPGAPSGNPRMNGPHAPVCKGVARLGDVGSLICTGPVLIMTTKPCEYEQIIIRRCTGGGLVDWIQTFCAGL